ncbi:Sir2 histone deacetylase Hst2 [Xylographa parallela]|nr:Sir2 histone deacetylase Hst2 [Xylographa parallela]
MGQEASSLVDEDIPPQTLDARSVEAVADFIIEAKVEKIVVMVGYSTFGVGFRALTDQQTGAGISTSAGIPDFRSPDTGLYANLARLDLPHPEAVFDISFFRKNPLPFYMLANELYPGKYRPTIAHCFIRLLSDKGMLLKLFTQNIDCLEREAGVPDDKIVEAHGSFARQRCIECKTVYPDDLMRLTVEKAEVPYCITPQCNGLVKPDIVFFGEQLPEDFFRNHSLPSTADLCIVMGTSLSVQPFASLPGLAAEGVPRILINKELVGDLGSRADDVLIIGDCDEGVRRLASALGWLDELEALWTTTQPVPVKGKQEPINEKTKDEIVADEVAKITDEIEKSLNISANHTAWVKQSLSKEYGITESSGGAQHTHDNDKDLATATERYEELSNKHSSSTANAQFEKPSITELQHVFPHMMEKSTL